MNVLVVRAKADAVNKSKFRDEISRVLDSVATGYKFAQGEVGIEEGLRHGLFFLVPATNELRMTELGSGVRAYAESPIRFWITNLLMTQGE